VKLRVSKIVTLFICALSVAASFSKSDLYAQSAGQPNLLSRVASSVGNAIIDRTSEKSALELTGNFESGLRSSEFIQSELSAITGDTPLIRWNRENIKHKYKLSQIYSHVHNLESGFELLFEHTLPDQNLKEDMVTYFTSQVNEADQNNLGASLVISKYVQIEHGRPVFDNNTRSQYFFYLKADELKTSFNLRQPVGTYRLGEAKEDSFNPLAILTTENGTFDEIGDYQYDLTAGGTEYVVTVTPRLTDIETLTIEVEMREVHSLATNSFVLVYEQQ
jgi:hypothetical protein